MSVNGSFVSCRSFYIAGFLNQFLYMIDAEKPHVTIDCTRLFLNFLENLSLCAVLGFRSITHLFLFSNPFNFFCFFINKTKNINK